MKVLLINGSPHKNGCTYTALCEVEKALQENGIETEIFHIGSRPVGGCVACGGCGKTGQCIYQDTVNEVIEKLPQVDGLIFGSPVYYASPNGSMLGFMDRLFYAAKAKMEYKPAAVVTSARRAGTTACLDAMMKYLNFSNMPIVPSVYWNMVHGSKPEDVLKDAEGLQIMRTLGYNMAWMLQCLMAGRESGVPMPKREERVWTNFIQ